MLQPQQIFKIITSIVSIIGVVLALSESANSADKAKALLVLCAFFLPFLAAYIIYEIVCSWLPKSNKKRTSKKKKDEPLPAGVQFSLILLLVITIGMTLLVHSAGFDNIVHASLPKIFQPIDPFKPEIVNKYIPTTQLPSQTTPSLAHSNTDPQTSADILIPQPYEDKSDQIVKIKQILLPPIKVRVRGTNDYSSTVSSRIQQILDDEIRATFSSQAESAKVQLDVDFTATLVNPVAGTFSTKGEGVFLFSGSDKAYCHFNWGRYSDHNVAASKISEEIMPILQHALRERKVSCSVR